MEINVLKAEYHRNGIEGRGFYTILFEADDGGATRQYMATVFSARHPEEECEQCDYFGECPNAFNGLTAVLDTASLLSWTSDQNKDSYISHWRGDHFERPLRQWLWDYEKERELSNGFDSMKHFETWKKERALARDMQSSDRWLSQNRSIFLN